MKTAIFVTLAAVFAILAPISAVAAKISLLVLIGAIVLALAGIIPSATAWTVGYIGITCVASALVSFVGAAAALAAADLD